MSLSKVDLVTAFSAGLGATIAKALISEMRVVMNYHSSSARANTVLQERDTIINNSKIHDKELSFLSIKSDVMKKMFRACYLNLWENGTS